MLFEDDNLSTIAVLIVIGMSDFNPYGYLWKIIGCLQKSVSVIYFVDFVVLIIMIYDLYLGSSFNRIKWVITFWAVPHEPEKSLFSF